MQGDQQANQQIQQIMQAAQQGDPQATQIAQMIQAVAQQMQQAQQQQQVRAARFGAKLNYIRQLNGTCPEGYEIEYYKAGGQICKRCAQKKKEGGNVTPQPTNVMDQFRVEAAKCGKKMKKAACGKKIETNKCGGKQKKTNN